MTDETPTRRKGGWPKIERIIDLDRYGDDVILSVYAAAEWTGYAPSSLKNFPIRRARHPQRPAHFLARDIKEFFRGRRDAVA